MITKREFWEIVEQETRGFLWGAVSEKVRAEMEMRTGRLRRTLDARDAGFLDALDFVLDIPAGIRRDAEKEEGGES